MPTADPLKSLGARLERKAVRAYLRRLIKNPPPTPPTVKLENGDLYPDARDISYIHLYNRWNEAFQHASVAFFLTYGAMSEPPKEWVYPFPDILNGDSPPKRLLWLETLLSDDDLALLPRVIRGIEDITEEGLKDDEKN